MRVQPGASLRTTVRRTAPGQLRFVVEVAGQPACTGECAVVEQAATVAAKPKPAFLDEHRRAARFSPDGTTLADVLARAASLATVAGRVCVASADRLEVAAAVVAALCADLELIFPPALTADAVLATSKAHPFAHWLGPERFCDEAPELRPSRYVPAVDGGARFSQLAAADRARIGLQTGGTTAAARVWRKSAANLLDEVAVHAHALNAGVDDHIVATVPPHHIYGLLFSVVLPLVSGATVERESPFFPEEIADRIERIRATILVSTPAHLRALATTLPKRHCLRLVLSSGAPLSSADAAAFAERTGIWPLEVYGSTETGGIAVRVQDLPDRPWAPIAGVDCRMEGDALAVRSAYVSDRASVESDGFFVTADLVHIHPDGRFDLLGRGDGIVKVGGQRVVLPEIEKAVAALDGVTDAVVLALSSRSGRGQEIVALVASARPATELARELRERLPSPGWPRRLRSVDAIPMTASGKRDRAAILRLLEGLDVADGEETGSP
jgi:acyl-coenzyme A synthetase/AMP-(fatty) acid ligase